MRYTPSSFCSNHLTMLQNRITRFCVKESWEFRVVKLELVT